MQERVSLAHIEERTPQINPSNLIFRKVKVPSIFTIKWNQAHAEKKTACAHKRAQKMNVVIQYFGKSRSHLHLQFISFTPHLISFTPKLLIIIPWSLLDEEFRCIRFLCTSCSDIGLKRYMLSYGVVDRFQQQIISCWFLG